MESLLVSEDFTLRFRLTVSLPHSSPLTVYQVTIVSGEGTSTTTYDNRTFCAVLVRPSSPYSIMVQAVNMAGQGEQAVATPPGKHFSNYNCSSSIAVTLISQSHKTFFCSGHNTFSHSCWYQCCPPCLHGDHPGGRSWGCGRNPPLRNNYPCRHLLLLQAPSKDWKGLPYVSVLINSFQRRLSLRNEPTHTLACPKGDWIRKSPLHSIFRVLFLSLQPE